MMEPDDEVIFGRVVDDSRRCLAQLDSPNPQAAPPDPAFARASFELHGETLRALARWYPNEMRVRLTLLEWELSQHQLDGR